MTKAMRATSEPTLVRKVRRSPTVNVASSLRTASLVSLGGSRLERNREQGRKVS
jgi:hypothetical protein